MVATSTRKGVIKGFPYGFAWIVSDGGSTAGQAGSSLAQNAVSAAFLMKLVRTAGLSANTPGSAIAYGGDRPMVQVADGDTLLQQFSLEYGALDFDMLALLNETTIDSTFSDRLVHVARNPTKLAELTFGFAFVTKLETIGVGADGPKVWGTFILPRCRVDEGAPEFGQSEGSPNFAYPSYTITPNPSDKYPGGLAFIGGSGDLDLAVEDGVTDGFWIVSRDNPVFLDSYKSDGIATTFDLTFTPASTGTSTNDGNIFIQYDDSAGTAALITPSDITGKTVTIAAPEADDIVTALYQVSLSDIKAA
jgi:hypothetical protein